MRIQTHSFLKYFCLFFIFGLMAYTQTKTPVTVTAASTMPALPSPSPIISEATPAASPTPVKNVAGVLIPLQTFEDGSSSFCQASVDLAKTGGLTFACEGGKFSFLTAPKAKDNAKNIQIAQSFIAADRFTLEAELVSESAAGKPDQNNYGFIFGMDEKNTYTLRFKGPYYRFEKNLVRKDYQNPDGKIFVSKTWNWNYSAAIKPAGNQNQLQLTCVGKTCSLLINQQMAARFNLDEPIMLTSLALFAETGYYQPFGKVSLDNLHLFLPADTTSVQETFIKTDALTTDGDTFSKTGLSGAFNRFEADGFHFSPVVAYGYYGVKSEPTLGDVSVSATVRLNPDNPNSSKYGGLVCRSSLDGMYFAVIRESGYFSVFRDSPTRPFSLLAEAKTKAILTGGAANRLSLDCVGNNISFYVNDTKVASIQDSTFNLIFGRAGLFTKAGKFPDANAIIFSDYEVREIRQ